jgi:hypothetical protein
MKVRWTQPCERCKKPMPVGSQAIRFHGRLWHLQCVDAYTFTRRQPSDHR